MKKFAIAFLALMIATSGVACSNLKGANTSIITAGTTSTPSPTTPPLPSNTPIPERKSYSVSTEKDLGNGYTCKYKINVWDPYLDITENSVIHPNNSSVATSAFKPQTDIVIPASLEVTNTTQEFDSNLAAGIELHNAKITDSNVTDYLRSGNRFVSFTWVLSSGNVETFDYFLSVDNGYSNYMVQNFNTEMLPVVAWDNVSPNKTCTLNFFFIIKNYYSPATPKGNLAVLDNVQFGVIGVGTDFGMTLTGTDMTIN